MSIINQSIVLDQKQIVQQFQDAWQLLVPSFQHKNEQNIDEGFNILNQIMEQLQPFLENVLNQFKYKQSQNMTFSEIKELFNEAFEYNMLDEILEFLNKKCFKKLISQIQKDNTQEDQENLQYLIDFTDLFSEQYEEILPNRRIQHLNNQGIFLEQIQEYQQAEETLQKGIFLSNLYFIKDELENIFQILSTVYFQQKKYLQSIQSQEQALEICQAHLDEMLNDPKIKDKEINKKSKLFIAGQFNLGECYEKLEQFEDSLEVFEKCYESTQNLLEETDPLCEKVFIKLQSIRSQIFDLEFEREDLIQYEKKVIVLFKTLLNYVEKSIFNEKRLAEIDEELILFSDSEEHYKKATQLVADLLGSHHEYYYDFINLYNKKKQEFQHLIKPYKLALKQLEFICQQLDEYSTDEIKEKRKDSYKYKLIKLVNQYDILGDTELFRPKAIEYYKIGIDIIEKMSLDHEIKYGKKQYNVQLTDKKKFFNIKIQQIKNRQLEYDELIERLNIEKSQIEDQQFENQKQLAQFLKENKFDYKMQVKNLAASYLDLGKKCESKKLYDDALVFYEKSVMIVEQFFGQDEYFYPSYMQNFEIFYKKYQSGEFHQDQSLQNNQELDQEDQEQIENIQNFKDQKIVKQKQKEFNKEMEELNQVYSQILQDKQKQKQR